MGRLSHKIEIHLTVDNHNGPEQERDRQLTEEIERRIGELLAEPKFEHLNGWIS